jgi:hypothetical protein
MFNEGKDPSCKGSNHLLMDSKNSELSKMACCIVTLPGKLGRQVKNTLETHHDPGRLTFASR